MIFPLIDDFPSYKPPFIKDFPLIKTQYLDPPSLTQVFVGHRMSRLPEAEKPNRRRWGNGWMDGQK